MTEAGTHVERLVKADPPFWCETCGGMHALSQHRNCRTSSRRELLRTWAAAVRKDLSAHRGDGTA